MFKRKKEGNIIVLSGPSGSGKTSISKYITSRNSNIVESVSMTTREKRVGETDGVDYYFISKEEFTKRITNDEFLEYAIYGDNYYGTPKENVYNLIKKGIDVILVIEIEGALKIKELVESKVQIYDIKKQEFRDIKYKDIVILLRSTKNKAPVFEKEMISNEIPVFSDTSTQYLDSMEINTIMSLLKIIKPTEPSTCSPSAIL